ncbi:AI-2E family transporter [Aureimonas endophytica]|uniref:AI-2E family transporter n=1 Tax=Aureimonas endophytica TaxID=2027858 RepID=A0A917E5L4_9HYPH|nr:AI-2E family transporter [Aureimonas endophytica]GGE06774.1 AI-2E family transporter [Aureimonas endophytica]
MSLEVPLPSRPDPARTEDARRKRLALDTVLVTGIVLAMLVLALVVYAAAPAFLIVFASLLVAAIFCGIARLPQRLGLPRGVALLLVYLLVFAALLAPLAWGGVSLAQQFNDLLAAVRQQAEGVLRTLSQSGLPLGDEKTLGDLQQFLPNPSGVFSSAGRAVLGALGGLGNLFVVLFLAIFISWQPGLYRDGLVSLLPKTKRARVAEVLGKSAHSLIMWVAGDAISMATIFAVSWIGLALIGINNAFLLALQAGLLAFVPTIGPFVAGVVIVLAGLAQGPQMALWALGVYLLIQGVESNVAQPIAQRMTSALPPALTLSVQIVFGILFGLLGFVLAVPMVAVIVTLVRELYIDDVLGGPVEEKVG